MKELTMRSVLSMTALWFIATVAMFSPASSHGAPEKSPRDSILGDWKLRVKDGALTATVILSFKANGEGVLYTFSPADKTEKEGALLATGFAFEVTKPEDKNEEHILTLSNCEGVAGNKATMRFNADGVTLRLKGGRALRVTDKRGGIEMTGKWMPLAVNPFGHITAGPGGAVQFGGK